MRPQAPGSVSGPQVKSARCAACGELLLLTPGEKSKGLPAKQCSCGATYCPDCYDKLPGIFGEELGPIVMIFTPLAATGAYVAYFGMHGTVALLIFGISIIAGIGIYVGVVAPLSQMFRIAKRCGVCGGRTASDWRSLPMLHREEEREAGAGEQEEEEEDE